MIPYAGGSTPHWPTSSPKVSPVCVVAAVRATTTGPPAFLHSLLGNTAVSPQTRPESGHSYHDQDLAGRGLPGHQPQPGVRQRGGSKTRQEGGQSAERPLPLEAARQLRHRPLLHPGCQVQEQLDRLDHRRCQGGDADRERVTNDHPASLQSFRIPPLALGIFAFRRRRTTMTDFRTH